MTDGIGRIFGGNNYGVGGYVPQRKEEAEQGNPQEPVINYEETQVDPSKVMEFLANNNYFVAPAQEKTPVGEVDAETVSRVEGYMENFERIYGIIVEEFGEELAPMVMDMVMDKLMAQEAA